MLVIGIGLLLVEAAIPGFFIAVPGTILLVIGGLLIIAPDLLGYTWSPLLFAAITVVISILTIMFYKRLAPGHKPSLTSEETLVGKKGRVVETVTPGTIDGKVKIDEQVWSATSDDTIETGEQVVINKVSGVHVIVSKER